MTSSPPTLSGFNNNVRYRGLRFHIQTEDSGITRPHITTHLFADGGYVIGSQRTAYMEYVDHPERASIVARMMREQHRAMALALRDGKLDATIDRIAPSLAPAEPAEPAAIEASPSVPPAATPSDIVALLPPTLPPAALLTSTAVSEGVQNGPGAAASAVAEVERPAHAAAASHDQPSSNCASSLPSASSQPSANLERSASANASHRDERPNDLAHSERVPASERPASANAAPRDEVANGLADSEGPETRGRTAGPRKPASSARPFTHCPDANAITQPLVTRSAIAPREESTNSRRPDSAVASAVTQPPSSHSAIANAVTHRPPGSRKPPSSARPPSRRPGSPRPTRSSKSASNARASAGIEPGKAAGGKANGARPTPRAQPPSSRGARPPSTARANHGKPNRTSSARANGDINGTTPRPPSSRSAAIASSNRAAAPSASTPPSSRDARRAGRPSAVLAQPGASTFGALPPDSLDDAILTCASQVKNGPSSRGSK